MRIHFSLRKNILTELRTILAVRFPSKHFQKVLNMNFTERCQGYELIKGSFFGPVVSKTLRDEVHKILKFIKSHVTTF